MSDPIFLGLSKDEWVLINSFGNWLSAIGTVAAVWVSLHLANRISTPKANVSVGHRIILKTAVEYIPANKNQHKLDKEN